MTIDYRVKLDELCKAQNFTPAQVVSTQLVYPRGAVPNSQVLWVRVELTSGDRKFITLPLSEFYCYIDLPESSIGGWTDGEVGSDSMNAAHINRYAQDGSDGSDISGHHAGNEADDSGSSEPAHDDLSNSSESNEGAVDERLPQP
jgi:hypothetical protein